MRGMVKLEALQKMLEIEEYIEQLEADHIKSVKVADELMIENKELREQLEQAKPSEAVTALLDLLEPDIKRSEQIILHDERLIKLIGLYREIRPGGAK